jgi:phage tail sheath protein FI
VIGDQNTYFDFDNVASSQKIVVQGDHPIVSRYIRVEQSNALINGEVPVEALPFGFRGPSHLVTSGSGILALSDIEFASNQYNTGNGDWNGANVIQPPIPYRQTVSLATGENKRSSAQFYWGIQTSRATDVNEPNRPDLFDNTFFTLTKYFSNYQLGALNVSVGDNQGVADKASGAVLDSDRFDNNRFTLGRVRVRTGSDGLADPDYWMSASYVREGGIVADVSAKTRAFSVNDLSRFTNKKFAKFTFYMGGGFDGTNVFNKDQYELTNNSALREMTDSTNQGGTKGSTVASFRKATDVMGSTSDVDIKLLSIPGMRHSSISNYAISTVENRFDAMYIMDVEERDALNSIVTSSADQPSHVANTVASFKNRALDTSFAAAYFPDVVVQDPTTRTSVRVPPSVAVMGAFSLNDAIGHPWFAPAGFTRGSLSSVTSVATSLNRNNMDDLYDADINPLTSFPGTSVMVFGQKTLLAMPSSLDRVNVRRLLINVRRQIRNVANRLLFEPNRQETLDKFNALVNPIMQNVQEQSGVDRYKVVIDTTTTTQADVENNTLRGKIFLQPTRTAEFISLDFVVTNAGADI